MAWRVHLVIHQSTLFMVDKSPHAQMRTSTWVHLVFLIIFDYFVVCQTRPQYNDQSIVVDDS